jgi:hypothetical protein
MSGSRPCQAAFAAIAVAASLAANAATFALEPVRDNTIFSDAPDRSNGAGPAIFTGANRGDTFQRALVAFDLDAIPAGSIVTDASLTLYLDRFASGPHVVSLHRVLADWGEGMSSTSQGGGRPATAGDATWTYSFFDTVAWTNPGGDFIAAASASRLVQPVAGANVFDSTPALVADVQSWIDDPAANFGWTVIGVEDAGGTAFRFGSREAAVAFRPVLTIEVTPIPEPTTWALLGAGLLLVLARVRGASPFGPIAACLSPARA